MTKKKTTIAPEAAPHRAQAKAKESRAIDLARLFAAAAVDTAGPVATLTQFPEGKYTSTILSNLAGGLPDIRGLLYYLAAVYQPKAYLELGVRLGYSMAMVATASPKTKLVGLDKWEANYGGEANGSAGAVEDRLRALGCNNPIRFLNGDSHIIFPQWFIDHPAETFDLILVDANHTYEGVLGDLTNCLPQLNKGGFLVLDDLHDPETDRAWQEILGYTYGAETLRRHLRPSASEAEQPALEYYSQGIVGLIHRRSE